MEVMTGGITAAGVPVTQDGIGLDEPFPFRPGHIPFERPAVANEVAKISEAKKVTERNAGQMREYKHSLLDSWYVLLDIELANPDSDFHRHTSDCGWSLLALVSSRRTLAPN